MPCGVSVGTYQVCTTQFYDPLEQDTIGSYVLFSQTVEYTIDYALAVTDTMSLSDTAVSNRPNLTESVTSTLVLAQDYVLALPRSVEHAMSLSQTATFVYSHPDCCTITHYVDASSGNQTIGLPPAGDLEGVAIEIKKVDATGYTVTITAWAAETMDGVTSWTLDEENQTITFRSNGTNWYIV